MAEDSIESTSGLLHLVAPINAQNTTSAEDIAAAGQNLGGNILATAVAALFGMCGRDIDCRDLSRTTYRGTERYLTLNNRFEQIPVTAFVSQDCNNTNSLSSAAEGSCDDAPKVGAVAQAMVVYKRPACYDAPNCTYGFDDTGIVNERPNLFNPFWQATLAN